MYKKNRTQDETNPSKLEKKYRKSTESERARGSHESRVSEMINAQPKWQLNLNVSKTDKCLFFGSPNFQLEILFFSFFFFEF